MRFRTRAFLLCFVPFTLLMTGSFWAVQRLVQSTVRDGLRLSLRENHQSIARLRSRSDLQNSRFLRVAGENASLKAGIQLLLSYPENSQARLTVEDQLRELCGQMGFDFMMVSSSSGAPLAGVLRKGDQIRPVTGSLVRSPKRGLFMFEGDTYQIASVPVDQGEENLGELAVGERFDLSEFSTATVLIRDGTAVKSSLPGLDLSRVTEAFRTCHGESECDIRVEGVDYISLPLQSVSFGSGYVLRSLQNVDAASRPIQAVLSRVFITASAGALLLALLFSVMSSQTIVKPIAGMIAHLKKSESTGLLPEFHQTPSTIREIRELTSSFNIAAASIRQGRENLQNAYVEFVGSLANALDARDRYTAGHSERVSELSCATGAAMGISPTALDQLRLGSLLHDIGKIGVPDHVLQKPGRLTDEEFASIKQHPQIGRRILEGVHGFAPYLAAVELHHENWDGTGYPHGQKGEETPIAARIIHVSDAYDAMTTDRPYRRGMSHQRAIEILQENAGKQFDPAVVAAFIRLSCHEVAPSPEHAEGVTA